MFQYIAPAFAQQIHLLSNGKKLTSSAAHIYRARPDGSQLEVVISGGVDWLKDQVLNAAQEFRAIQTGRIQEYVLVSVLIGWALAVVVLLINSGFLDGIF